MQISKILDHSDSISAIDHIYELSGTIGETFTRICCASRDWKKAGFTSPFWGEDAMESLKDKYGPALIRFDRHGELRHEIHQAFDWGSQACQEGYKETKEKAFTFPECWEQPNTPITQSHAIKLMTQITMATKVVKKTLDTLERSQAFWLEAQKSDGWIKPLYYRDVPEFREIVENALAFSSALLEEMKSRPSLESSMVQWKDRWHKEREQRYKNLVRGI